jgi:plastocyanin
MPAGQRVEVHLENLDEVSHNFSLYRDADFQDGVFNGDVTAAGSSRTYTFESPTPGRYWFRCDLHTFMNGEVDVLEEVSISSG